MAAFDVNAVNAANAVDKYSVSYAPITSQDAQFVRNSLTSAIEYVIRNNKRFYIGVAMENLKCDRPTPIQSLCKRMDSRCPTTGVNTCSCPCHHDADERAGDVGLRLAKLVYSEHLTKVNVCDIERGLINQYKDRIYNRQTLCLNKNRSAANGNCITTPRGIVYLRIYI